jgi:hypothetical protein
VLVAAVVQVGVADLKQVVAAVVVRGNACLSPCRNLVVLERL